MESGWMESSMEKCILNADGNQEGRGVGWGEEG